MNKRDMLMPSQPVIPSLKDKQQYPAIKARECKLAHDLFLIIDDDIHIGEYWLKLPPKKVLQAKLYKAMVEARARLELRREGGRDE